MFFNFCLIFLYTKFCLKSGLGNRGQESEDFFREKSHESRVGKIWRTPDSHFWHPYQDFFLVRKYCRTEGVESQCFFRDKESGVGSTRELGVRVGNLINRLDNNFPSPNWALWPSEASPQDEPCRYSWQPIWTCGTNCWAHSLLLPTLWPSQVGILVQPSSPDR